MKKKYKSIFFGTPDISVYFLEKLKKKKIIFDLIITNPDQKIGRKQILTPSPVKKWAQKNNINFLQPEKINDDFLEKLKELGEATLFYWDFFFVFAYGKILPKKLLDIPKFGTLNLHPSLLPKYRGPSPITSSILDDQKNTGVSLIILDEEMDHGPIIFQEKIFIRKWIKNYKIEKKFAEKGAEMFSEILNEFLDGKLFPEKQEDLDATYCKKYFKKDMELLFPFSKINHRKNFLKYCAFPKPFYIDKNNKRNVVSEAKWKDNSFIIKKIIPEGEKEREY